MEEKMNKISYEMSMRLIQNYNALNKSYKNLSEAMKDTKDLSEGQNNIEKFQEIYIGINELLLWIVTTNDWFERNGDSSYKRRRKKSKKGRQILGIRYAFNRFKHNMDSINLHSTGFSAESIENKEIKWMPVIEDNENFKNQFENYETYIQGRSVIKSFTDVVDFLRNEFQRTKF